MHTGGSPSAEGGAQTKEEDRPFVDTSNDEELARRMQVGQRHRHSIANCVMRHEHFTPCVHSLE